MPAARTLDDRIDALYAGPSESFITARDALAKELKKDGDKDGAAVVKALRKPTAAAWAVNQLAHTAKRDLAKLIAVGDTLRDAHEALADGQGDAGIRTATTKRRKLVGDLTERAVGLLGAGGEAQRDAISNTLDAAVADPDAGISVQEGRLTKELSAPSGFGAALVFATAPAPRESASRREERRAARAASRSREAPPAPPRTESTTKATTKPTTTRTTKLADARSDRAEVAARNARIRHLEAERDRRTTEAQLAAREAAKARQEVSRLQDELVTASAKAKAADEKAKLTQWAAATAHQTLSEAFTSEPG